jgi:acetylornithine deacetylase/succinyl-diaminopimelate desuccinylase-like protein
MPTITYGLRGLAYMEVNITGPKADLHSGLYGGAVHNPAQVLTELIAKMHDEKGRITLPGFYDRVRQLSDQEREDFKRLPNDDQSYLDEAGVPALWGEEGYTSAERVGARPTLEVNGLLSGWTGPGSKTVLPARRWRKYPAVWWLTRMSMMYISKCANFCEPMPPKPSNGKSKCCMAVRMPLQI